MPDPIILLAEDSDDDAVLIAKSLKKSSVGCSLIRVRDGEEAIAYLKGEWAYSDREKYPLPTLVLLDLKMPRKDGFDVLHWIRHESNVRGLRVIVLTSSDQMRDVNNAYRAGANSFLLKPLDFYNFAELGQFIKEYWLNLDAAPNLGTTDKDKAGYYPAVL